MANAEIDARLKRVIDEAAAVRKRLNLAVASADSGADHDVLAALVGDLTAEGA